MSEFSIEKHTLGRDIMQQLASEALSGETVLRTVKLKLSLKGEDRGYLGLNKKQNGDKFICDVSEKDATTFDVKSTKYSKSDHFTYEVANDPYKGRWMDYHAGKGEVFAESHRFTEFDIAIWEYKNQRLQALIGKQFGELPICGDTESILVYASERMTPFEVVEEVV